MTKEIWISLNGWRKCLDCNKRTHKQKLLSHKIKRCYLCKNKKKYKYDLKLDAKLRNKYFRITKKHNLKDKHSHCITKEEMLFILNNNCVYCGSNVNITIDRINSNKGYTKENTQSVCLQCNIMKLNHTESVFLNQVKRIYEFRKL